MYSSKFLVKMISLSLSLVDDPDKFQVTLVKLTEVHNKRGVKAIECASKLLLNYIKTIVTQHPAVCEFFLTDGIVGEVLFWTLRKCLGRAYDARTHGAYVKILSRMLKVMVPVAVAFEMNNSEAQQERLSSQHASRAESRVNSSENHSEAGSQDSSSYVDKRYG